MTLCRTMNKSFFGDKWKPFNPWVVLAMWLHIGAPQKVQENLIYNPFWIKFHHKLMWRQNLTYLVLHKACENTYIYNMTESLLWWSYDWLPYMVVLAQVQQADCPKLAGSLWATIGFLPASFNVYSIFLTNVVNLWTFQNILQSGLYKCNTYKRLILIIVKKSYSQGCAN
jgi:hypothetical protein